MLLSDQDDAEPEIIGYRLTLTIAGPHHSDEVVIEDGDPALLQPQFAVHGPDQVVYEIYVDRDGFVEYRLDYVIARRLEAVYEEPPATPAIDPETIERAAMDMPAEERLRRPT
ncbi:MAG: hypothetical protein H0U53_01850 [Actinobacteria bacterium]|nr:hypothetical protein [Actinomycetota bacterium]